MAAYEGKADFAKVDIDQLSDLAFEYQVNSVPTVIAVRDGKKVAQFVGLLDDDKIRSFVKTAIEKWTVNALMHSQYLNTQNKL